MRKCLIIMPMLFHGGAEKQFRMLITGLDKDDEVEIIVLTLQKISTEYEKDFIRVNNNTEFFSLNIRNFTKKTNKLKCLFSLFIWLCRYRNIYKKGNILVYNYTGLIMLLLYKLNKCTIIFSERNSGEKIIDNKIKRMLLKKCDYLTCNSIFAKEKMEKVLERKVKYIANGIHLQDYFSLDIMNNSKEYMILIPARICMIKNQMIVCEAIKELKDNDYKFIFAGPIEDEAYYSELVQFIKVNNLKSIEFLGFVENMKDLYDKADLVILPSLSEGTPNVILESFSVGKLCLASDIEMNSRCFQDDKFLFNKEDPIELKEKIQKIRNLTENSKKKALYENYEYVKNNFSSIKMINEFKKMIC